MSSKYKKRRRLFSVTTDEIRKAKRAAWSSLPFVRVALVAERLRLGKPIYRKDFKLVTDALERDAVVQRDRFARQSKNQQRAATADRLRRNLGVTRAEAVRLVGGARRDLPNVVRAIARPTKARK